MEVPRPHVDWWSAVEGGDVAVVEEWLRYFRWRVQSGAAESFSKLMDRPSHDTGSTGLHHAVQEGRDEVALMLLEAGSQLDVTNSFGSTPLHAACYKGMASVVKWAIARYEQDPKELLRLFSVADKEGSTPLHECARKNRVGVAEMLLMYGVDRHAKDSHGKTPGQVACAPEMRNLLRET